MPMQSRPPVSRNRRIFAVIWLVLMGVITLPLVALFVDTIDENLIAPVHVGIMLAMGIAIWTLAPGVAAPEASTSRGIAVGAGVGFIAAVAAYVVFFFLLSGFGGA